MRLCTGSGCPELIKKEGKFVLKEGNVEIELTNEIVKKLREVL